MTVQAVLVIAVKKLHEYGEKCNFVIAAFIYFSTSIYYYTSPETKYWTQ